MSTQVTISKKTIRKIAAAIAAVNNSREVGGLFMGYRHSSKYRIVDATVPDCEKCSGVASFVLDGAEETAKAEALVGRYTNTPEIIGVWHSHIWGDAVFSLQDEEPNRRLAQILGNCLSALALPEKQSNLRKLMIWEIDPAGEAKICRAACETENIP